MVSQRPVSQRCYPPDGIPRTGVSSQPPEKQRAGVSPVIVLASGNPHKREEILRTVGADPSAMVMPEAIGEDAPDPVEDGGTYLANAIIKARAFSTWASLPALADDTGLEVEALDGAPGVLSARYSGADATYESNVQELLAALEGRPPEQRRARFVCVLALCLGKELLYRVQGVCPGQIIIAPRGSGGFGYDPVFVPDGETHTFAELSPEEKDRISHRGLALQRLARDVREGRFPMPIPLATSDPDYS